MDVAKSRRVAADTRVVVLAAGASTRTGGAQKLLMPFRGRPLIDHALEAVRERRPLVVASPAVAAYLASRRDLTIAVNDAPARGMAHSLALADAAIPANETLIVVLGDKPLLTAALVARIEACEKDADVVYPVDARSGEPGHPVRFSPRARAKIAGLPDGDSLRLLRDDPSLTREAILCEDPGAFFDADSPETFDR